MGVPYRRVWARYRRAGAGWAPNDSLRYLPLCASDL